ncbi:MAG: hypothetical protein ACREV4_16805 [Gammaproteobacteria bacterium]
MAKSPSRPAAAFPERSGRSRIQKGERPWGAPLLSFRYSYRELSSLDGKTHVKAKECRFEDGKITTEEFEGTTGLDAHTDAVRAMHRIVQQQAALLLQPLSWLLRSSMRNKPK